MSDSLIDNIAQLSNQAKSTGKEPYRAYGNDKNKDRQINLEIREKSGNGFLIPYGQITLIKYTSNQFISLFCAGYVCNIEGKHLDSVIALLQDSRVRYIQEFDKSRFLEVGTGEAVVERIEMTSLSGKQDIN